MKKIILNHLPPSNIEYPASGLSTLKSFLIENGYDAQILYWNILTYDLLAGFKRSQNKDTSLEIIPFLSMLLEKYDDEISKKRIKALLFSKCDKSELIEQNLSDNIFLKFKQDLISIVDKELSKIPDNETILFGFSSKFGQWIPALVLANIVKSRFPKIKTVIGGFSNKNEGLAIMQMYNDFDFAIWGEGEYPLLKLSNKIISNNKEYDDIPRLIKRINNEISISENNNREYLSFKNELIPNYDDFIFFNYDYPPFQTFIPYETTRGCH